MPNRTGRTTPANQKGAGRPERDKVVSRQERRRQERRQVVVRQQQRRSASRWYIIGGAIVVLALLGTLLYFVLGRNNASAAGQPGGSIDGINCQAEMLNYHIHAHLTLYWNGNPVVLPAQVGIPINPQINVGGQNYCLYYLHTHDTSGVIHIESPTAQTYTLGQFFDIWHYTALWDAASTYASAAGVTMDGSFVDALRAAKPGQVHAFVNGKPVSSYKNITLTAHEIITVELGTPVRPPATSFKFPNGE